MYIYYFNSFAKNIYFVKDLNNLNKNIHIQI